MSHTPEPKDMPLEDVQTMANVLTARIHKLEKENADLLKAIDIEGLDRWFLALQMAVRGNENLINECGQRIERMRAAVTKATDNKEG